MTVEEIKTSAVLKVAGWVLSWLIMGLWTSAKISTGFEFMRQDMRDMKQEIRVLSGRFDTHLENSQKGK
jgi:hypothetical protein